MSRDDTTCYELVAPVPFVVPSDFNLVGRRGTNDSLPLCQIFCFPMVYGDFFFMYRKKFPLTQDELRDLDSLSEPFPDQHGCSKGGESYSSIMGMHGAGGPAFRQQHQLLSRGGPVVKTEATAVPPSSTASQTTVRLTSAALAAAAPAGVHHRPDFVVVGARKRDSASPGRGSGGGGGYYSSAAHISSSAGGRHANPATASGGGTGGATSTAGDPHGVSAANSGGTHLHHHNAEVASHAQQASTSSHGTGAVRGRPVVSGMGIMVGRGPPPHHQRSGVGGAGGGDEDRKFVGAYSPEARRKRIERFHEKREHRVSRHASICGVAGGAL